MGDGRFDPAAYDRIQGTAQEINDAIKRLPGNRSIIQGTDRAAGTVAAVSTWDTEAHARFDRAALGDLVGRLQGMGVHLDAPEIYEVTVE